MDNVTRLFKDCTTAPRKFRKIIDGSAILSYTESPFGYWCNLFAPKEKQDPPSEFMALLAEKGGEHETQTVQARYPGLVPMEYRDKKEGFLLLLKAMQDRLREVHGVPMYYLPEGLLAIPDIIELSKAKDQSVFGKYHYVVKDVKLARNIKEKHVMQVAFYNYVLGKVQGFTPPEFYLINGDMVEHAFLYKDHEQEMEKKIEETRAIAEEKKKVDPTFNGAGWPWETYCNELAIKSRDVTLVPGVKETLRGRLLSIGIQKIDQLAKADPDKLTKLERVGHLTAHSMVRSAQALVSGKVIKLHPPQFPPAKLEIFMDFESTGMTEDQEFKDIDYLIGLIVRKGGTADKGEFVHFLANKPDQEERMIRAFLDYMAGHKDYIIYHWSHYELTHLKKLFEKYGVPKGTESLILGRMVDLYKLINSSFVFPTYGRGIKDIAAFVGFKWRQKAVSAMESIALYLEYTRDPVKHATDLQKILDYNEDDCRAMVAVRDWTKNPAK